jgi:hypothetical protein
MSNYLINIDKTKKIFLITLEGSFGKDDILNYLEDFKKDLNSINPAEYQLQFEANKFKVLPQDLLPAFTECFKLYKQASFKKIIANVGDNAVQKMQVRRVMTSVGLDNFEIV